MQLKIISEIKLKLLYKKTINSIENQYQTKSYQPTQQPVIVCQYHQPGWSKKIACHAIQQSV